MHCCVYTHILERCITETEPVTTHWEPLAGCPALINTESEAVWGRVTSALVSWPSTQFTYNFSYSWGIRRRRKRSHNSKPDTEIWARLRDNPPTRQAATEAGGPLHLVQGVTEPALLLLIAETLTHRQTQHGSLCLLTMAVCLGPRRARDEALRSLLWGGWGHETERQKRFTCIGKLVSLRPLKDKLHLYFFSNEMWFQFFVKQSHFPTESVKADKWWKKIASIHPSIRSLKNPVVRLPHIHTRWWKHALWEAVTARDRLTLCPGCGDVLLGWCQRTEGRGTISQWDRTRTVDRFSRPTHGDITHPPTAMDENENVSEYTR